MLRSRATCSIIGIWENYRHTHVHKYMYNIISSQKRGKNHISYVMQIAMRCFPDYLVFYKFPDDIFFLMRSHKSVHENNNLDNLGSNPAGFLSFILLLHFHNLICLYSYLSHISYYLPVWTKGTYRPTYIYINQIK